MARRNSNGEGTIYRRKDGRYEGAVYLLTTDGTRKRVSKYGATRAEVHAKLTEAKANSQQGIPIKIGALKLSDYLDYWLAEIVKPNRRPATYEQCEAIVRIYLKPSIGSNQITKISVPLVQTYLNQQVVGGRSLATVHAIRKVLSSALTAAQREELVLRNAARLVQLPSYESAEVNPWSFEEAIRLLNAAQSHMWYLAFQILLLYGLRRGEVLGMRWQDIDFENGVIHVRQQLHRVNRELRQDPLKTKASRRDLPMLSWAEYGLRKLREQKIKSGTPEHDLVFTTAVGTPIEPRNFVRAFMLICQQNGLRRIKVHALRHTVATMLKNLGVSPREAQLILGHSNVSVTQQIYQHGDMNTRREALGRVEIALADHSASSKTPQDKSSGELVFAVDGSSSRTFSRQESILRAAISSFQSGATTGTRTQDPFLTMRIQGIRDDRITEVKKVMEVCTRQWIFGVTAVKIAVKIHHF